MLHVFVVTSFSCLSISFSGWVENVCVEMRSRMVSIPPPRMAEKFICSIGEKTRGSGSTREKFVLLPFHPHVPTWTPLGMNPGIHC